MKKGSNEPTMVEECQAAGSCKLNFSSRDAIALKGHRRFALDEDPFSRDE